MQHDELEFLEEQVAGTELLFCQDCQAQTLHAYQLVLDVLPVASVVLMECTHCQATQSWLIGAARRWCSARTNLA